MQTDEAADETDAITDDALNPTQERFGGIYLGDDIGEGQLDAEAPVSFDYTIHRYGDEKRKKKSNKLPTSDESRYFQMMASMNEDEPEQNMKMKFFDVDSYGCMYQKQNESLVSGLDRMN